MCSFVLLTMFLFVPVSLSLSVIAFSSRTISVLLKNIYVDGIFPFSIQSHHQVLHEILLTPVHTLLKLTFI